MKPRNHQDGFVLVTVLWTIALLSALAFGVATTFRSFSGIVAVAHDRTKATELLAAGLAVAGDALQRVGKRPLSQKDMIITLATGTVRIELSDETGRVNINKAPIEVLTSLLHTVGVVNAEAIAPAIVAFRSRGTDAEALQTPKVKTAPPLTGAGDVASNSQHFDDIRQLSLISGISPNALAELIPLTTVYGNDKINALTASPQVISAIPGMQTQQVDALVAARRQVSFSASQLEQIAGQAQRYLTIKAQPIALAMLTARLSDGYMRKVEAVIVCVRGDALPYRVLAWKPLALPSDASAGPF